MQLLSHGAFLADATAFSAHPRFQEFLLRDDVRHFALAFAILLLGSQFVYVLSLWIASKILLHRDDATLVNALKVWGFGLLLGPAIGLVMAVIANVNGLAQDTTRMAIVVGGTFLFALFTTLLIPMKVYVIGLLRAVGLLLVASFMTGAVMSGLEIFAFVGFGLDKQFATLQASFGKTPQEQQSFLARLMGREAPNEIDRLLDDALRPIGPQPSLREREAMVAVLQQKLTAREKSFPRGAPIPPAFQDQLNRYREFLNEVLAERHASAGPSRSLSAPPAQAEPSPLQGATPAH